MVHDGIGELLDFLNLAFGGVLVLLLGFTLKIVNSIHLEDLMNLSANLILGMVFAWKSLENKNT